MCTERSIELWLRQTTAATHEALPSFAPTAYATPPVSREASVYDQLPTDTLPAKRKRSWTMTSMEIEDETPRKKQRPGPYSFQSTSSSIISLDDTPGLPHPREGSVYSRASSPKRDLLNELRCARPAIEWAHLQAHQAILPPSVNDLLKRLVKGFGSRYIPLGLQVGGSPGMLAKQLQVLKT